MLKKFIAAFCAAVLSAGALSAVQTSAADDWREAYNGVLKDYCDTAGDPEEYMYELFDIDSDGTPELIVSTGAYNTAGCYVYTYYGSQCVQLYAGSRDCFVGDGYISAYPEEGLILVSYSSVGFSTLAVYKLADGQCETEVIFSASGSDDFNPSETKINGEAVDADTYYLEKRMYTGLEAVKNMGRKYSISQPISAPGRGDIDGNGRIDAIDASAALAMYAAASVSGDAQYTAEQKNAADVDGSGIVDSKDASLILMYYSVSSTGGSADFDTLTAV